ncbi:hypothetical protein PoMZ_08891 [Pyricularia oryzae]|uniref:Uncharacterized protein n=1 Tax=Pyricularia oryzae TaxID=318829 RepID=A0A4P7NIW5_PYROR|nr:hypothetical protein PoMZ_08891 [Pyricularia oryzae]
MDIGNWSRLWNLGLERSDYRLVAGDGQSLVEEVETLRDKAQPCEEGKAYIIRGFPLDRYACLDLEKSSGQTPAKAMGRSRAHYEEAKAARTDSAGQGERERWKLWPKSL